MLLSNKQVYLCCQLNVFAYNYNVNMVEYTPIIYGLEFQVDYLSTFEKNVTLQLNKQITIYNFIYVTFILFLRQEHYRLN